MALGQESSLEANGANLGDASSPESSPNPYWSAGWSWGAIWIPLKEEKYLFSPGLECLFYLVKRGSIPPKQVFSRPPRTFQASIWTLKGGRVP